MKHGASIAGQEDDTYIRSMHPRGLPSLRKTHASSDELIIPTEILNVEFRDAAQAGFESESGRRREEAHGRAHLRGDAGSGPTRLLM